MYFIEVEKRHAFAAAIWNCAIVICGALVVINYVQNPKALLAALAGGFIGTFVTVRLKKK